MGIFTKSKAESAQAVVAEDQHAVEHDELATTEALLAAHIDDDPAANAAQQLMTFRLSPGARNLLDRAMDNVAKNKGSALPEDARGKAMATSDLIEECDNDLAMVLDVLEGTIGDAQQLGSMVYSTLYTVLKSAVFIANLDYRRALDPRGDFDLRPYLGVLTSRGEDGNDPRDEGFQRDASDDDSPLEGQTGHETRVERELRMLVELYGPDAGDGDERVVLASLQDLRLFFTLTTESFGWDPENPMPYGNIAEKDGTFTPLTDAEVALDAMEIKRKESQVRRNREQTERLIMARELARKFRQNALRK